MSNKWPGTNMIAYFQAYTNTQVPLSELKKLYDPYFEDNRFIGIDVATRSDRLDDEKITYFKEMSKKKDLTIEIGLQSIHKETGVWMNRGHALDSVKVFLEKLKKAKVSTCVHIINGLPVEEKQDMMETIDFVAKTNPEMIKIHMLHLLRGTVLGNQYIKELLAPEWTKKKTIVLNDFDKEMHRRNTWQGKYYKEKPES